MILEVIGDLLSTFLNQLVTIPLDNTLGVLYVVLNAVLQLFVVNL